MSEGQVRRPLINLEPIVPLLRESVLIQGTVTIVAILTVCYLAVTGQPVPDLLEAVLWLVLGFYFGAKSTFTSARNVESATDFVKASMRAATAVPVAPPLE